MIGCLRTPVRKQPITVLYFEFETVLKFYNLEACSYFGELSLVYSNNLRCLITSSNFKSVFNNKW